MRRFIITNSHFRIGTLFALILLRNTCFSQCILEIQNKEIDDISAISICLENEEFIQYTIPQAQGRKLLFEVKDFTRIRVSQIGYYDTTILIKNSQLSYSILLRPKIVVLDEVIVKKLQSYTHIEEKNRKGQNLLFQLEPNKTWYFNIGLTQLGAKRLDEISIEINTAHKQNKIEVRFFEDINAAINSRPRFIYIIDLKKEKNNLVKIFSYKQNNLFLMDDFIIGLRLLTPERDRYRHRIAVMTKFQQNETQIYYQTERGVIHKMPNEYYLKHFGGYPMLISTIKYEK